MQVSFCLLSMEMNMQPNLYVAASTVDLFQKFEKKGYVAPSRKTRRKDGKTKMTHMNGNYVLIGRRGFLDCTAEEFLKT